MEFYVEPNPLQAEARELLESPTTLSMESLISTIIIFPPNEPLCLRKKAIVGHCLLHYPNALSLKLSHLSSSSNYPQVRSESLKFLYTLVCATPNTNISPMILPSLKSPLLSCFKNQMTKPMSLYLSKIVCNVASRILDATGETWKELIYCAVHVVVTSPEQEVQESGIRVLCHMPESIWYHLRPRFDFLWATLLHHSLSPDFDFRTVALSAAYKLIKTSPDSMTDEKLQHFMSIMVTSTYELVKNNGDQKSAEVAARFLAFWGGLADDYEMRQRLFMDRLDDVLESMVRIAEGEDVTEGIKDGAISILKKLDEFDREKMNFTLRNLKAEVLAGFMSALMSMLVGVAGADGPGSERSKSLNLAAYFLDRVSYVHSGGTVFVPLALDLIEMYRKSEKWQKHHAAVDTLSAIIEGCYKGMLERLDQLVPIVLDSLQDPHPRVRWVAADLIRVLSMKLAPTLHEQCHHRILPLLATLIEDQYLSVQMNAADAIHFFSKDCRPDYLAPFLTNLVSALLILLENESEKVKEGALGALAIVASSSTNRFDTYYDPTVASIKAILFTETDPSKCLLRAQCLECISYVANAVGKDRFTNDARQVMQALIDLQGSMLETDHLVKSHISEALDNFSRCLGSDMCIYAKDLMPVLIESANINESVNEGVISACIEDPWNMLAQPGSSDQDAWTSNVHSSYVPTHESSASIEDPWDMLIHPGSSDQDAWTSNVHSSYVPTHENSASIEDPWDMLTHPGSSDQDAWTSNTHPSYVPTHESSASKFGEVTLPVDLDDDSTEYLTLKLRKV